MNTSIYQKERLARLVHEQKQDALSNNHSMTIRLINQITDTLFEIQYNNDHNTKQLIRVSKTGNIFNVESEQIYHEMNVDNIK